MGNPERQPLRPRPAVPCAIGTLFDIRAHLGDGSS
jgi:hypothetical protein